MLFRSDESEEDEDLKENVRKLTNTLKKVKRLIENAEKECDESDDEEIKESLRKAKRLIENSEEELDEEDEIEGSTDDVKESLKSRARRFC